MTRKKPADIALDCLSGSAGDAWQVQYIGLQALTKCGPDALLTLAMGQMWDAYTNAVSREVGDENEWLDWYCWDNDMGAKGLEVTKHQRQNDQGQDRGHLAR